MKHNANSGWFDVADLGYSALSDDLPESRQSGEPEGTRNQLRPSLEDVLRDSFGGNDALSPFAVRKTLIEY
jgi:hypothetical protein